MTPEDRYLRLVEAFAGLPGVARSAKKGFGGGTLTVGDKIFAMLVRGRLVVKLPRARVDALAADGTGARFDMKGRVMKEWLAVDPAKEGRWLTLAREALEAARGATRRAGANAPAPDRARPKSGSRSR